MLERSWMLIGAPVDAGTNRPGCGLGPQALRAAGLQRALEQAGARVIEGGDVRPASWRPALHPNAAIHHLAEVAGWTVALEASAFHASALHRPIFLGGDHSLSAGTVAGMARRAQTEDRPLFVLWLDAHADCHTLDSTTSGNLHGVPVAYLTGAPGFAEYLPPLTRAAEPGQVCMLGVRSIDPAEHASLQAAGAMVHDMRALAQPTLTPLRRFLDRVADEGGLLHVSIDADVLDPAIAPGVGTAVPGGASVEQVRRVLAMVNASDLVRSLDLVELNPLLDQSGRTAAAMVALAAGLCGGNPP